MSLAGDIKASTRGVPQFSYEPLNSEAKEIRLFVLLPGAMGKPILSRMKHASLKENASSETESYEALSYTWGSANVTHRIHIDGIPFRIRRNLYKALSRLRLLHAERVLWIDAICINQNDLQERNHQVRQMVDIYSRASSVLIWLGLATLQSKRAITFIRETKNIRFTSFAPYESQCSAVRDLCMRPYWQRVWIIQEVGLAQNLQIICGTEQVSWDDFSQFMFNVNNSKANHVPDAVKAIRSSHAARILEQRASFQSHRCSLWRLLRNFADSLCTLPHDKVYGVLGLASDCGQDDLVVNYTKPLIELHRDVLLFYNRSMQGQTANEAKTNSKLPNIVSFSSFLSRLLGTYFYQFSTFRAGTSQLYSPGLVSPAPAQTFIPVEATILGVITMVGEVRTDFTGGGHHFEILSDEPGLEDDAYFQRFLSGLRELVIQEPMRLNKPAQYGIPLREEEKLYLEASKRRPRPPAPDLASGSTSKDAQGHVQSQNSRVKRGTRWLKATNDLRGIGNEGTQVGDLLYTLSKYSRKLIIRPEENEYTIVGTAVLEYYWSTHDSSLQNSLPSTPNPVSPPAPSTMNLYLEVETLQILTLL